MNANVLSIDFGASNGRAILCRFDGEKIELQEIHRFSNDPVIVNGTMYWDVLRLYHEIKQSLIACAKIGKIDSLGIDTWGVDFALIDKDGKLISNPVHYRDKRTDGMLEKAFALLDKQKFYGITGNQFMEINTAFQLLSVVNNNPQAISSAESLLLMPDLFNFFLTGIKKTEYSIASTTQLLDARRRQWSDEVISALGIKRSLFTDIIPTATKIGTLTSDLCEELNIDVCDVIAVAGHDTQCAMASVPSEKDDFIFLSCGTWSLLGTELEAPVINATAEKCNLTNEGGYLGKTSFLKNIIGLWLIQETRRQWQKENKNYSFAGMEILARSTEPLKCFIDPDAPEFVPSGNIPERVIQYCRKTEQYVPQNDGEVLRCIYDSLAMKYRYSVEQLELCTEKKYDCIHMVGGGTKDTLLSQLTANSCCKNVITGPVEATVLGNAVLQLLACGKIADLKSARKIIKNSEKTTTFIPQCTEQWNKSYKIFLEATDLC